MLPNMVRAAVPSSLRNKAAAFREDLSYLQMVIRARLGIQSDFVGYETLIDYINANKLYQLNGDFLEIGAFMGGGSAKLAKYGENYRKRLIVIDVFDPGFDDSETVRGERLNVLYRQILGHGDQRKIFDRNTKHQSNIVVYSQDSQEVTFPVGTQLCFSFIDGNHYPHYVRSDFHLAWNATVSGGVVGFHDYGEQGGSDLPQVTETVDVLIRENQASVAKTQVTKGIMLLHKK
jgi:Methyltransferase domain